VLKRLVAIGVPAALLLLSCPVANADIGGQVPAPGLCEYPGVGGSGMIGVLAPAYYYWCDFPTELNGSHWHCEDAGAAGQGTIGFSMMFQAGLSGPVGGIVGSCTWRCPDLTMAEAPNPPGGWKDAIRPTKCKTIGPNPHEVPAPVSEPIGEQGAVPSVPFGQPQPPAGTPEAPPAPGMPPTGAPAEILPSVTDPVCPNPDATVTSSCHGAG
jgi:hypothetical protein